MGHNVTAIVAGLAVATRLAREYGLPRPVAVPQGLAVLALRVDDLDRLVPSGHSGHAPGFFYLSRELDDVLRRASELGPVAYVETEYFGGVGTQGAAAYVDGARVYCAAVAEGAEGSPINDALRAIGVRVVAPAADEFDAVGLGRHRDNDGWIEAGRGAT